MIKKWIKAQEFLPGCFGFIVNPFYFVRRGLYLAICEYAQPVRGKVLDLGCGSKPYRSLFSTQDYVGIDIENPGHSHANEAIDLFYDGKRIPFPDSTFDFVFSSEVVEHIECLDQVMGEIERVLKPGGQVLLTAPFVWSEHELPHDYRRFTQNGLRALLESKKIKCVSSKKSTKDIETLFQNMVMMITLWSSRNRISKWMAQILLIAPLSLMGILCARVLPDRGVFYSNIIILGKKA